MKRAIVLFAGVLILAACSPVTIIHLTVDVDSYVDDDLRTASFVVPTSTGVRAYLLPGLQVDETGVEPDEDMRIGLLIDLPSLPTEAELEASVFVEIDFVNLSESWALAPWVLDVVLAAPDSSNLYSDGIVVGSAESPALAPLSAAPVKLEIGIREGDEAFTMFESGAARIGVTTSVGPSTGEPISAAIEIKEITIDVSFRAYSVFRLF